MFSQVFIRSTACRLNSTLCRRHFFILAILPPFDAKCVFSPCLTFGVHSTGPRLSVFIRGPKCFLGPSSGLRIHTNEQLLYSCAFVTPAFLFAAAVLASTSRCAWALTAWAAGQGINGYLQNRATSTAHRNGTST